VNGNLGVATSAQNRTFQVEGHEIHSGGFGAGFSFSNRGSAFVEGPAGGERWVLYAAGGVARLWSGTDKLTVDTGANVKIAGLLGTRGHDPVAGLPSGWAGGVHTWDVYAEGALAVGRGGAVAGYLSADGTLSVNGDVHTANGRTLHNSGRLHVHPQERLYLLPKGAVYITNDWGASGDLYVTGHSAIGGMPSWSGGGIVTWDVFARGWIYTGGVNASVKKFVIDHPVDPGRRELVHACLEGPEVGVYYRGEAGLQDGEATIELPEYFEALTHADGRTVVVTPKLGTNERFAALAASAVQDGRFRVRAAPGGDPSQRFYWEVKAVRSDLEALEVEPLKDRESAMAGAAID
jgi:hypothetical protein